MNALVIYYHYSVYAIVWKDENGIATGLPNLTYKFRITIF